MTTPSRCDTADHQFLAQEAIPDDVVTIRNWLPFQLNWTLWALGLLEPGSNPVQEMPASLASIFN